MREWTDLTGIGDDLSIMEWIIASIILKSTLYNLYFW